MFRNLGQKIKNRKGFTLIELIVVIAILGILALIAIPRLTGFQQDAKVKADIANAKTIANEVAILVAKGDITVDAAAAKDVSADAKLLATMNANVLPTPQLKGTAFTVTLGTDGKVTVKNGSEELYPTTASTYK